MIVRIHFAAGRRRVPFTHRRLRWDGPVTVCREFGKRERVRFDRMCRLLDAFGADYETDEGRETSSPVTD